MSYYGTASSAGPRDRNRPMNGTLAAILLLEAIVVGLSVPVMIVVSHVPTVPALIAGLGVAVVGGAASGLQTRRGGRAVGSLVQVAAVALGLLTPLMAFLGTLFAICWVSALLLEDRIKRLRAERGLDRP